MLKYSNCIWFGSKADYSSLCCSIANVRALQQLEKEPMLADTRETEIISDLESEESRNNGK